MHTILPIQTDFSLRHLNSFGIDARAHAYVRVTQIATLSHIRRDPVLGLLPRLVLGGGSNIVLTTDFDGLVLHIALKGIAVVARNAQRILVRAAAGESWHGLVQWTLAQGFGGLENLSWIPGSVGAAPIQNIGAYGVEAGSLIDTLRYYDFVTDSIVTLDRAGCQFGYRDSIFKQGLSGRAVILEVTFALPVSWTPNLDYAELRQALALQGASEQSAVAPDPTTVGTAVIAIRSRKLPDPAQIGNAGSFFKNPLVSTQQYQTIQRHHASAIGFPQPDGSVKLAAGWLIDQCGWKGRWLGAAGVYEKQALVLVNRGNATGADILRLACAIQDDVHARFGVRLDIEPVVVRNRPGQG